LQLITIFCTLFALVFVVFCVARSICISRDFLLLSDCLHIHIITRPPPPRPALLPGSITVGWGGHRFIHGTRRCVTPGSPYPMGTVSTSVVLPTATSALSGDH